MFQTVNTILFATDLSPNSRTAFEAAVSLATQYQAKLVLLHVVNRNIPSFVEGHLKNAMGEEKWNELAAEHHKDARSALIGKMTPASLVHTALQKYCADAEIEEIKSELIAHEIVVAEGEVIQAILDNAATYRCDVIVVSARKGFLTSNSIGPTAKGVMRKTRVPVLFVPPRAEND